MIVLNGLAAGARTTRNNKITTALQDQEQQNNDKHSVT